MSVQGIKTGGGLCAQLLWIQNLMLSWADGARLWTTGDDDYADRGMTPERSSVSGPAFWCLCVGRCRVYRSLFFESVGMMPAFSNIFCRRWDIILIFPDFFFIRSDKIYDFLNVIFY